MILVAPALGACGSAEVLDQADVDRRIEGIGSPAPELIYVTEADSYRLAHQSVGVYGADGFSSHYASDRDRAMFQLAVDRGTSECTQRGIGADTGTVTCEEDGDLLYRQKPDSHEYARAEDGHVVRVSSRKDSTDRETLREAAEAAHRAEGSNLDSVLPPPPDLPRVPVKRGDMPEHGDGAPDNSVGVGG